MTEQLPAPLVPAEVDLRDFAFLPLDVLRLRDSDLACVADPELFRAAVLSWCVAWHQTPAGSLPDDDTLLARLLGYGRDVKGWKKLRAEGGLRGWVRCTDGRLYHPVVAEKALDAWRGKLGQRWRTEIARAKKHNQRHSLQGADAATVPDFEEWVSLGCPQGQAFSVPGTRPKCPQGQPPTVPRETPSKGQGEGQGQGQGQGEGIDTLSPAVQPVAAKQPPGTAPPRPTKKAPASFLVDADLQRWAREKVPAVDIRAETEKFRDYTFPRAISDWPGTWRNWMRTAAEKLPGARPLKTARRGPLTDAERAAEGDRTTQEAALLLFGRAAPPEPDLLGQPTAEVIDHA